MRWGALGAAALTAAAVVWGASAQADQASCKEFRDNIIKMEERSARPPGWFSLDGYLRRVYQTECIQFPARERPAEYWYRADGTSTGVPTANSDRPGDAAYAATKEIGDVCLQAAGPMIVDARGRSIRAGLDPSICALQRSAAAACENPVDGETRNCKMILGEDAKITPIPKGEELPPIAVGLDGGPYVLGPECQNVLGAFGDDLALDNSGAASRPEWLRTMQSHCPDFLAALERRAGVKTGDARFWPAFGQLLLSGFPTAQQAERQRSLGSIATDEKFLAMCKQANDSMNVCAQRQANMRTAGTPIDMASGTRGQAGAFNQCAILYGQVHNFCNKTKSQAERVATLAKPATPKPQPPQQPQQQAKPADGQSRPPQQPAAPPQMSAQCQQLVGNYVQAAQANDGARAVSGYNALKSAGGCGVLNKVDRPLPQQATAAPGPDPRFPSRGATPLSDSTIGACDLSPAECAARVQQLKQGTSAQAQAALFSHSIGIGLQLGSMMAGGMMMAMPQGGGSGGGGGTAGGGTNMNSIGPGAVKGTYGQGGPSRPAPPNSQSTITGTK